MIYGYARVSTDGQTLDSQREALIGAGAEKVFAEKASGIRSDRPELVRVLAAAREGDTLLVTRLDRLARSTVNLLSILDGLSRKGTMFRSLNENWADTTTPHGRLTVTIVGGVAEFERELIRARTSEGRARAKARGQSLGRRPSLTPHQQREVRLRKLAGDAVREIARTYNVSASTISRVPR
jgi:DNA invertase Pin-like site-specific DNA recombinase